MKFANIKKARRQVIRKARQLWESQIATTWSEAMSLAWDCIKTLEKVNNGEKIEFIKKSTGKLRTVINPAPYKGTGKPKKANSKKRKPQPQLVVLLDLDKEGYNVISLDIRNLIK